MAHTCAPPDALTVHRRGVRMSGQGFADARVKGRSGLEPGRRTVLRVAAAACVAASGSSFVVARSATGRAWAATAPGAGLDPAGIAQFVTKLPIPGVMPSTGTTWVPGLGRAVTYDIALRQTRSQILPAGMPATTVWGYGVNGRPSTVAAPSATIEARWRVPIRVRWSNQLLDRQGRFLPPLLPVDQTLHWANPPGGEMGRDSHPHHGDPTAYVGPVPAVTHVHGAITFEDSDGYPEAWYLPAATNIPNGYATVGSAYEPNARAARGRGAIWTPGSAVFDYPNDQPATTLWYHDHSLGMTRTNVYAGPAGFYIVRGGPGDVVRDARTLAPARLPGPAPAAGDGTGIVYRDIPIAIQDRSFGLDGSLMYPDSREFFDGFTGPYSPHSDIAPIWNPEFFGNALMVNGVTWPYLEVQARRYRLRLLNGCQSRFLILRMSDGRSFWQIGAEGGMLPRPVELDRLLIAPAERADVIVDFAGLPPGTRIVLENVGPDEPFGGGEPGEDFEPARADTTGRVLQFKVVAGGLPDPTTPPSRLVLPAPAPVGPAVRTRRLSLNEMDSEAVDSEGGPLDGDEGEEPAGPAMALLGTVADDGRPVPLGWADAVTETATRGQAEIWEIHNFTMDAHPIHLHATQFQVIDRRPMEPGDPMGPMGAAAAMDGDLPAPRPAEAWERGRKDTVIAYPGEVTRIRARFDVPGRFVWHCHILEHEDNEMMRPFDVL